MYKKLIKYSNRLKFFILLVYVIKRSLILDFELLIVAIKVMQHF